MKATAETNKSRLWLGLLVGGAIGATASSLLTPKSGTKLREELSSTYRSLNEKRNELSLVVKEKAKDLATNIAIHASELSNKTNEGKNILVDSLQNAKDDIRDKSS
jgi:gas vesicle protein